MTGLSVLRNSWKAFWDWAGPHPHTYTQGYADAINCMPQQTNDQILQSIKAATWPYMDKYDTGWVDACYVELANRGFSSDTLRSLDL